MPFNHLMNFHAQLYQPITDYKSMSNLVQDDGVEIKTKLKKLKFENIKK